jgi:hypothetical protein
MAHTLPTATLTNLHAQIVLNAMLLRLPFKEVLTFWREAEIECIDGRRSGYDAYRYVYEFDGRVPFTLYFRMIRALTARVGTTPAEWFAMWLQAYSVTDAVTRGMPLLMAYPTVLPNPGKEYDPVWSVIGNVEKNAPLGQMEFLETGPPCGRRHRTFAHVFDRYYRRYDATESACDCAPISGLMAINYGVKPLRHYHVFAELSHAPSNPDEWECEGEMRFSRALHTLGFVLKTLTPPDWEVTMWRRREPSPFYPQRCIYRAPLHICRYHIPESPLLSRRDRLALFGDIESRHGKRDQAAVRLERALREGVEVRYIASESSVFIDGTFITSGIQGRILIFLVEQAQRHGKCAFRRRELAQHPELVTTRSDTGLSLRLRRISSTLQKHDSPLQLVPMQRGVYRIEGAAKVYLIKH